MQLLKVCFCTRWHPCLQLTINSLFMTWDQGARNSQRIWITAVFKQVDPLIWGSTAPLTAPQRCCFSPHHQIPWLMLMILLSFTCSRPDCVSASYSSIFSQLYIQPLVQSAYKPMYCYLQHTFFLMKHRQWDHGSRCKTASWTVLCFTRAQESAHPQLCGAEYVCIDVCHHLRVHGKCSLLQTWKDAFSDFLQEAKSAQNASSSLHQWQL